MLTGLVVFLLVLIAVLAIPIAFTFDVSYPKNGRNDVRLRWLFGLVRVRLSPSRAGPARRKPRVKEKTAPRRRSSPRRAARFLSLARESAMRRAALGYLSRMWRAIRKRNVHLHLRIGLGDPADTGRLWILVGPLAALLANIREASIEIEPEFSDETIELDGRGAIQVVPLQLLVLTGAMLLSPQVWRGIRQMRATG